MRIMFVFVEEYQGVVAKDDYTTDDHVEVFFPWKCSHRPHKSRKSRMSKETSFLQYMNEHWQM